MNKWANEWNRAFSKEEVHMAKKLMKKCSPSLAIKEMQIKASLRFHLTPVKNTTTNVGEDVGENEPLFTAGGNVKLVQPL
jgi:hypothetical protein